MKVYAGGILYDATKEVVGIVFDNEQERMSVIEHLKGMTPEATIYASFPDYADAEAITEEMVKVRDGQMAVNEPKTPHNPVKKYTVLRQDESGQMVEIAVWMPESYERCQMSVEIPPMVMEVENMRDGAKYWGCGACNQKYLTEQEAADCHNLKGRGQKTIVR